MMIKLIFFAVLLVSFATAELSKEETDSALVKLMPYKEEIKDFILTKIIGKPRGREEPAFDCPTCQIGINLAFSFLEQGTPEEVENALVNLCIDLKIVAPDVCDGIIHLMFGEIYYILTETYLTVDDICSFLVPNVGCGVMNSTMTDWEIRVDSNKPPPLSRPQLPENIPTAKVLHLTDIHPDIHYAEGSLTDCGKPMCCRTGEDWEEPWNSSVSAGFFGDYSCDIPIHSMQNLFLDAASRYEYEFVMLGGDYVHHAVWLTTQDDNLAHYSAITNYLLATFPNTPIYPVVGNHEPTPVNLFPPTSVWDKGFNNSWVYNSLADLYASQLTPEALSTFRKAGYYSISPKSGIRLLALNTNFCYVLNFWILHESVDPEGQLQWFSDQMDLAEKSNEKVFILGHVPPGSIECWSVWNRQFNRVIDRYQNIIVGQFYGHTHFDDFKIFFDAEETRRPTGSLYIGSSVTPYTDLNPGYKVFSFDGVRNEGEWEMVDHESWIYNLTEANLNQPRFFKLYGAKEEYGLSSLRPDDLLDFVLRMAADMNLYQKFYANFFKNSDVIEECVDKDECRRDYLCSLLTSNDEDRSACELIDEIMGPRKTTTTPAPIFL